MSGVIKELATFMVVECVYPNPLRPSYSHRLLDEPTAAIDPFEEDRIYRDFMKLKKNHTAVVITHRLGAVRLADRVLVLKEGRIVAIGTHDRLLDESRYYRRLWTAQSKYLQ